MSRLLLSLALGVALSGCATTQRFDVHSTEWFAFESEDTPGVLWECTPEDAAFERLCKDSERMIYRMCRGREELECADPFTLPDEGRREMHVKY